MLCLLGPPAVRLGEVLRPLKLRPKALALLVRVALEGPVSRADLADLIFPERREAASALLLKKLAESRHDPGTACEDIVSSPASTSIRLLQSR
jgi:DNA-binding SARP family transcriptional activator